MFSSKKFQNRVCLGAGKEKQADQQDREERGRSNQRQDAERGRNSIEKKRDNGRVVVRF